MNRTPTKMLEKCLRIAKANGGECLSRRYKNAKVKLRWRCAKKHYFRSPASNILYNRRWCSKCAGNRPLTLGEVRAAVRKRRGILISKSFGNSYSKVRILCEHGHSFSIRIGHLMQDHWCRPCAELSRAFPRRLTLSQVRDLAVQRGGKSLAKSYKNSAQKLSWRCKFGHIWEASTSNIRAGKWCPYCPSGIGERLCRAYFEAMFRSKFPSTRPDWLKNDRGNQMHLDGMSAKLGIAFEHHGEQHYQDNWIMPAHKLRQRQRDDKLKARLCKRHGIKLFVIPELFSKTKLENLPTLIIAQSKHFRLNAPHLPSRVNISSAYTYGPLEECAAIARSRNGTLLSKVYLGPQQYLIWKCSEKSHRNWKSTPSNIKSGSWCPKCADALRSEKRRDKIETFEAIVAARGGKLLTKQYKNQNDKLLVECGRGHTWQANPSSLKAGRWCRHCGYLTRKPRTFSSQAT